MHVLGSRSLPEFVLGQRVFGHPMIGLALRAQIGAVFSILVFEALHADIAICDAILIVHVPNKSAGVCEPVYACIYICTRKPCTRAYLSSSGTTYLAIEK